MEPLLAKLVELASGPGPRESLSGCPEIVDETDDRLRAYITFQMQLDDSPDAIETRERMVALFRPIVLRNYPRYVTKVKELQQQRDTGLSLPKVSPRQQPPECKVGTLRFKPLASAVAHEQVLDRETAEVLNQTRDEHTELLSSHLPALEQVVPSSGDLMVKTTGTDTFTVLWEKCHDRLFVRALHLCHNDADAEDLLQEVALALLSAAGGIPRDEEECMRLAMTIIRHRFIDAWRRKKATQSFDDELHSNSDSEEADVLAGVLRKEFDDWQLQMRPKLRAVVMALPPERKELYFASLVDDLPPQGVVQKLIYRDGALHDRDKVDDQIRRLVKSIENQLGQLQPKG